MKPSFYASFSKQELLQRLIYVEKEKQYLVELLELKDQKLKAFQLSNCQQQRNNPLESQKIQEKSGPEKIQETSEIPQKIQEKSESLPQEQPPKPLTQVSTSFFDETFSHDYYRFQDNGLKAVWLKSSSNNLYSDYCHWPSVRTREIITGVKQFRLTMPGYGWIGLGTPNMRNDGFPGYTTEGWMLCTDGRVYHNQAQITSNGSINFNNKTVAIKVDAVKSQISVNGVAVKMGSNVPKEVYFVISIFGSRTPHIQVQP